MKTQDQESLKEQIKEIQEDIDTIEDIIDNLNEHKPEGWEKEITNKIKLKEQLEANIQEAEKKLDPTMMGSDHDSFILLTDRMIDGTIEAYFEYHIWTHPDMEKAIEDFDKNGVEAFTRYSKKISEWIAKFNVKKYKEDARKTEEEFFVHKKWVCADDPTNVFGFRNCIEYRDNIDPDTIINFLDDLCTKELEDLIKSFEIFHYASQRKEKERIFAKRQEKQLLETTELTTNSGLQEP